MNRETIKSIILAALVIISLFQTYSIWTYQGNFESKDADNAPNIKPIDPENDLSFSDVVKPYQLLHIVNQGQDQEILGTDKSIVDTVYNRALGMKWSINVSYTAPQSQDSYELVFPAPVKLDTIQTLFDFGQSKTTMRQDMLIDRIGIYQQGTKTIMAFKDGDETVKFTATSPEIIFEKGIKYDKDFQPYEPVLLRSKTVYIPLTKPNYDRMTYPFTLVDIKEFKPIFFNNLLKTYYDKGAYTDGDSLLKQDDDGYVLKYVNPATGSNSVLGDPIYQGYSFIDSHSGWTDKNFTYDYFESRPGDNQDSVDFRLTKRGLPIYRVTDFPAESMISMTWENGILYKVDRTLIKIGKDALSSEPSTVYSAEELKASLLKAHVSMKGLQDLRIGYRMEINSSSRLVNLTPDWFFKIQDQWFSLSDYEFKITPPNGGDTE